MIWFFIAAVYFFKVKWKLAPFPNSDAIQILPPRFSIIFLVIASPILVPGNSSLVWRRLKIWKIAWWNCWSIPIPLSVTEICQKPPKSFEWILISGVRLGRQYLSALLKRFWNICRMGEEGQWMVGSWPILMRAFRHYLILIEFPHHSD